VFSLAFGVREIGSTEIKKAAEKAAFRETG
jgi:hypothetical protein